MEIAKVAPKNRPVDKNRILKSLRNPVRVSVWDVEFVGGVLQLDGFLCRFRELVPQVGFSTFEAGVTCTAEVNPVKLWN